MPSAEYHRSEFADTKQPQPSAKIDSPPHIVINVAEDSPPPFVQYQAEFFETSSGDVVSHDHHLNEDGEALYRFLLEQSEIRPEYILKCSGTHQERRTRIVHYKDSNGNSCTRTESYTVIITDFFFSIDLTHLIVTGPVHWSYADSEPAYRGLMVRQVQTPEGRRKATKEETQSFKSWEKQREVEGLPPWRSRDGRDSLVVDQSSQTVRQWADEYGASPKYLKELVYEKVVHGWNFRQLEEAIRDAIRETQYRGNVEIDFILSRNKICIRPDNRLSRILSHTFYKILLAIFLVYPFIWLFKRYHSRGGGRWEICGGAYSLKHIEPVDPDDMAIAAAGSSNKPSLQSRIIETENGFAKLIGIREGEWFKQWEPTIKRSVAVGLQSSDIMKSLAEGPVDPACELDGYTS